MSPKELPDIKFPGMTTLETIETLEMMGINSVGAEIMSAHFMGVDECSTWKWKYYLAVAIMLRIRLIRQRHCS
jgi:hypothetical protein